LRSQQEWEDSALPSSLNDAQEAIKCVQHLVLLFPPKKGLTGRSARVIVTMGMVANLDQKAAGKWLAAMEKLGTQAD
jgi:putative NADPH-quinone reductase